MRVRVKKKALFWLGLWKTGCGAIFSDIPRYANI
jgi:hypothetical protein